MEDLLQSFSSMSFEEKIMTVLHHPDTLLHKSMKNHPEQPDRITVIINSLEKIPGLPIIRADELHNLPTTEEVEALMKQNHGDRFLEFVQEMWDHESKRSQMYINRDTYYCKYTYQSALAAAKTSIAAMELAISEKTNTFAVVRPPGHHSGLKPQPHGFSFINNVALAARKAIKTKKASRVAIIDWDAHHGEGTQTIFYSSDQVLYISLHRFDNGKFFPHVPQSGTSYIGEGKGQGFNINICWNLPEKVQGKPQESDETVGDDQYILAFQTIVMPVLQEFNPDLVLVSCGFDSAAGDPIGGLRVTSDGFVFMTQQLVGLKRPISFVFEGGYDLSILEWGSCAVIKGLVEKPSEKTISGCNKIGQEGIELCMKAISPYWKCLKS